MTIHHIPLLRGQRFTIPNLLSIFLDAAIATEESHPRDRRDALLQPGILILVRLIHELVRLDIAIEIIGNEIVIAMLGDAVAQSGEVACVAKFVGADRFEDFG